jgi:Mrp family chromosome partitioning ATPase
MIVSLNPNGNGNGNGNRNGKSHAARIFSRLFNPRPSPPGPDLSRFRQLAVRLHQDLPRTETPRSVLLTSPSAEATPAHAGPALARALGDHLSRPVLLVDADPGGHISENKGVSGSLNCVSAPGFADFLLNPSQGIEPFILTSSRPFVSFLPAGTSEARQKIAGAEGIEALAAAAAAQFDFVVYCAGPLTHDPIALALAPLVGCVLLLAVENRTRLKDLDLAQDTLSSCNARKMGILLTRAES